MKRIQMLQMLRGNALGILGVLSKSIAWQDQDVFFFPLHDLRV